MKNIIKTLKINHYIKNAIVIIPLIFSMNYFNLSLCLACTYIFFAFCAISSAVYVLNDLIDIEKDKSHPIKCNRPIASGKISKSFAIFIMLILIILSSFLALIVNKYCLIMIASYFILNLFYSLYLKNIALIDVACIALGFIFRVVAGCFAIKVAPSPFIILMTFFASMFFTFTKRKLEIQLIKDKNSCRNSIKGFDIQTINQFILLNAVLSIAFYFTYTLDANTIARAGTEYLYITTIPFVLIVFRLLFLINTSSMIEDDPIRYIEQDKTIKYLSIVYLIILGIILYI